MSVQIFYTLRSMNIKDWILAARNHAKITQTQLGDRLGVSKGNVSAWENGRHEASYDQLIKIAEITAYTEPLPGLEQGIKVVPTSAWPFQKVSESKIKSLQSDERIQLETAILLSAAQLGLDIKA